MLLKNSTDLYELIWSIFQDILLIFFNYKKVYAVYQHLYKRDKLKNGVEKVGE